MINQGRLNILGVRISAVDYEAAVEQVAAAAHQRLPLGVAALAVHGVMTGVLDRIHRSRLNHLDLLVPDGQPVRWALRWLYGVRLPDRVYGPTLMLKVCARAAAEGLPIYLYGSRPEVIKALCENLTSRFPRLVIGGAQASLFRRTTTTEKREITQRILASGAAITFVGLGCPRQEVWTYEYRDVLSMPVLAIGAAFDFHSGMLPQAPPQLQRVGLEWLFRLIQEPRRLWQRYLFLNTLYLGLLGLQASGLKQFDPADITPPTEELNFA
jgi:N-acetylglucosaminyldiphosphoundecaprenol N-acetyl-beta-D-mannosaminyltransferase